LKLEVGGRYAVSLNKAALVDVLVMHVVKPLLAGRGGEGERLSDRRCCVVELLLAGRGGEGEWRNDAVPSASSRCWCCSQVVRAVGAGLWILQVRFFPLLQSCHGGGVKGEELMVLSLDPEPLREGAGGPRSRPLEAASCGDPKRRQGSRRYPWLMAPLHTRCLPSSFNLRLWRPFDLGAGVFAGATPSGSVPGGGAGARAWRSPTIGGEDTGPDCVYCLSFKVPFAKSEDWVVFSFFFGSLDVMWPPLM